MDKTYSSKWVEEELTRLRAELEAVTMERDMLKGPSNMLDVQMKHEQQLAAKDAEIERLKSARTTLFMDIGYAAKQLAAHQLVIQKMREALHWLKLKTDPKYGYPIADKALALQPTTEALDAYVEEAVRREREVPAGLIVLHRDGFLESAEKAFNGSWDTLGSLIDRNCWSPPPREQAQGSCCQHDWDFEGEEADGTAGYFSCVKCGTGYTSPPSLPKNINQDPNVVRSNKEPM